MIKNCLSTLSNKYLNDNKINETLKYFLDNYEEDQLFYLLQSGININQDNIILHYYPGYGFKCNNTDSTYIGHKPICVVIEKCLNKQMYELLKS